MGHLSIQLGTVRQYLPENNINAHLRANRRAISQFSSVSANLPGQVLIATPVPSTQHKREESRARQLTAVSSITLLMHWLACVLVLPMAAVVANGIARTSTYSKYCTVGATNLQPTCLFVQSRHSKWRVRMFVSLGPSALHSPRCGGLSRLATAPKPCKGPSAFLTAGRLSASNISFHSSETLWRNQVAFLTKSNRPGWVGGG